MSTIGKELPQEFEDDLLIEHSILFIETITEAFPQFCFQCIIFKEFGIFKLIQIPRLFMPSISILLCCSRRYGLMNSKKDPGLFTIDNAKNCIILLFPITSFFFQISQFAFNKHLSRPESFVPAALIHPCFSLTIGYIFHTIQKFLFKNPSRYNIASRILKLPVMFYLQMKLVVPALISYTTPTLWSTSDQKLENLRQPGDDRLFFYRLFPEIPRFQVNPEDCDLYDINVSK